MCKMCANLLNTTHIYDIIRSSLTADMAKTVASALVNSRFYYANAVLYGTSEHNLVKLQRAQNALARVVITFIKRANHIQPVLAKLHSNTELTSKWQQ